MENNENKLNQEIRSTTSESIIVLFGKIILSFLGIVSNYILAKYYGSKILGEVSLFYSIINIISIFAVIGLNSGIIKYIAIYFDNKKKIYQTIKIAFKYSFILSFILSLIMFFFRDKIFIVFGDSIFNNVFIIGAWILIPISLIKITGGIYRAFKKMKYIMIPKIFFGKIVFIIFLIFFILIDKKSFFLILFTILLINLLSLYYLLVNLKQLGLEINKFLKSEVKREFRNKFLKFSSTFILISLVSVILTKMDKIMIGIFMSTANVGEYSIAVRISEISVFLLNSLNFVFIATISRLYNSNQIDKLNKIYSLITKWLIVFTLPIFVSLFFYGESVLNFFGREYIGVLSVLFILLIGKFISTAVGSNGLIMNMGGYEKLFLVDLIIMATINLLLNWILIPLYGLIGASIATGVSIAIFNIIKVFQVKKLQNIFPYNKSYLIIPVISLFIIALNFIFKSILGNKLIVFIVNLLIDYSVVFILTYVYKNKDDKIIFDIFKEKLQTIINVIRR